MRTRGSQARSHPSNRQAFVSKRPYERSGAWAELTPAETPTAARGVMLTATDKDDHTKLSVWVSDILHNLAAALFAVLAVLTLVVVLNIVWFRERGLAFELQTQDVLSTGQLQLCAAGLLITKGLPLIISLCVYIALDAQAGFRLLSLLAWQVHTSMILLHVLAWG